MPTSLCELLPWRAFDERGELYVNAGSVGFVLEIPPFAGIDEETLGALAGTLADAAPEKCTVQVIHWASPRFGAALDGWAVPREHAGPVQATMARRRARLLAGAGWRPLHEGGPPFTLSDYRAFVCASLAGPPGPAPETALSAFRRALEGTLASAGATARRLGPDALLSLASELTAPDIEPVPEAGRRRRCIVRTGAGPRGTRFICNAPRPAARSPWPRPDSSSTTRTAAAPTAPTMSRCEYCRRSPFRRSGRAGAATR